MNRTEFLNQREQLMDNIDSIVDDLFGEHFPTNVAQRDELVTRLCDMVCETMDPAGLVDW